VEEWTVGGTPLTALMDVERRHGNFLLFLHLGVFFLQHEDYLQQSFFDLLRKVINLSSYIPVLIVSQFNLIRSLCEQASSSQ
jgi:hypothetical protein